MSWFDGVVMVTMGLLVSAAALADELPLQKMIDDAVAAGAGELVLPAGRHHVAGNVRLSKLRNFTLRGQDTTLLFKPEGNHFDVTGCDNLTLAGFTIDCDPLPFTQGTISDVSEDHRTFTVEIHAGYPLLPLPDRRHGGIGIFVFHREARLWRQDVPDLYPSKFEVLDPTRCRITVSGNLPGYQNIQAGDFAAFKYPRGNALLFRDCGDLMVRDITLLSAPGAGFLYRACTGKVTAERCRIARGPTPEGASEPRLLSTVADGLNLGYCRQGITMTGCDFSFMGDDSVNLHGTISRVVRVDAPTTFWIARHGSPEVQATIRPGDEVRILDPRNFACTDTGEVVSCDVLPAPAALDELVRKDWKLPAGARLYFIRFVVKKPVKVAAGYTVEIPAIACPGFVFRDNYFHDHRARGLRLGASHGVIENNRFERIKSTAISLGPHAIHGEGSWVRDIIVRGNEFNDLCFDDRNFERGAYHAGAIVVQHFLPDADAPYPQENRDIQILANRIHRVGGAGILATSADNLVIRGNRMEMTHLRDCDEVGSTMRLESAAAISLNSCTRVTVEGNRCDRPGPFCRGEVSGLK